MTEGFAVSRRRYATVCLAALPATAGCLGIFDDDANGDDPTIVPLELVPDGIDAVFTVTDRMLDTDGAVVVLTELGEVVTAEIDETGIIAAYRDLLVALGDSPVDHEDSTLFYRVDADPYAAIAIGTDDDQATARDWVGDHVETTDETSHRDVTVSVGERDGVTEWLAPVGSDHLLVGTEPAARAVLDVFAGEAEAFGGELRRSHDRGIDGDMNATMNLDDVDLEAVIAEISPELAGALGLLDDPEYLGIAYRFEDDDGEDDDGEDVQVDIQFTMADADAAEGFARVMELFIEDADGLPIDIDLDEDVLDRLSVDRTDRYVTLTFETTVTEFASNFD